MPGCVPKPKVGGLFRLLLCCRAIWPVGDWVGTKNEYLLEQQELLKGIARSFAKLK